MVFSDEVRQFVFSIPYFTGVPTDVVDNVWNMIYEDGLGTLPGPTQYAAAAARLVTMYNAVYGVASMSQYMNKTGANVKVYDLTLPTPRVPVYSAVTPITNTPVSSYMPTEVAMCISFKAAYIGGIDPARQRGRVFIGGLGQFLSASGPTAFPNIPSSVRTVVGPAMAALRTGLLADNWHWVIASRAQVTSPQGSGQQTFDVAAGWIDDTPDTQRRRGLKTSVRTTW